MEPGAVRNADRIWASTPQNRTIGVNLRKIGVFLAMGKALSSRNLYGIVSKDVR